MADRNGELDLPQDGLMVMKVDGCRMVMGQVYVLTPYAQIVLWSKKVVVKECGS